MNIIDAYQDRCVQVLMPCIDPLTGRQRWLNGVVTHRSFERGMLTVALEGTVCQLITGCEAGFNKIPRVRRRQRVED